jgi:hypothetical protein
MEHELSPALASAEGTPPEQPGLEHGSIEEQLADAKTRTQQWQMKRVVTEHEIGMEYENTHHPTCTSGPFGTCTCMCTSCCVCPRKANGVHQCCDCRPTGAQIRTGLGPLPVLPDATKPFPIDVTDLTGATIKVEASLDTIVDALRALVHDQTGVDPDLQMLLVDNETPMEDETLALGAYGLRRGLRIQLTPQDPTRAAKRRLLRLEGREAAAAAQECRSRAVSTIGFIMVIIMIIWLCWLVWTFLSSDVFRGTGSYDNSYDNNYDI